MQVKEMIELLEKMDPELEVWLSSDEEGNRFRTVYEVSDSYCIYLGEVYTDDGPDEAQRVALIWP